jgi:hypothetical protein
LELAGILKYGVPGIREFPKVISEKTKRRHKRKEELKFSFYASVAQGRAAVS